MTRCCIIFATLDTFNVLDKLLVEAPLLPLQPQWKPDVALREGTDSCQRSACHKWARHPGEAAGCMPIRQRQSWG